MPTRQHRPSLNGGTRQAIAWSISVSLINRCFCLDGLRIRYQPGGWPGWPTTRHRQTRAGRSGEGWASLSVALNSANGEVLTRCPPPFVSTRRMASGHPHATGSHPESHGTPFCHVMPTQLRPRSSSQDPHIRGDGPPSVTRYRLGRADEIRRHDGSVGAWVGTPPRRNRRIRGTSLGDNKSRPP
jgi:hypothetical protein